MSQLLNSMKFYWMKEMGESIQLDFVLKIFNASLLRYQFKKKKSYNYRILMSLMNVINLVKYVVNAVNYVIKDVHNDTLKNVKDKISWEFMRLCH